MTVDLAANLDVSGQENDRRCLDIKVNRQYRDGNILLHGSSGVSVQRAYGYGQLPRAERGFFGQRYLEAERARCHLFVQSDVIQEHFDISAGIVMIISDRTAQGER